VQIGFGFAPAVHKAKLAGSDVNIARRPLRHEPAMETRLAGLADCAALRAVEKPRGITGRLAFLLLRALGARIRVECPLDVILSKAVAEYCAGMIENDGIGFARRCSQHAPDHLPEQTHFARRARENAARHFRHVPAFARKAANWALRRALPGTVSLEAGGRMVWTMRSPMDFMYMEIVAAADNGARLGSCKRCGNVFLYGKGTKRRKTAKWCGATCRQGGFRATQSKRKGG